LPEQPQVCFLIFSHTRRLYLRVLAKFLQIHAPTKCMTRCRNM
jgi:hypothetical protein